MTQLEIILLIFMYIVFACITSVKQSKASKTNMGHLDDGGHYFVGTVLGIIWPVTLTWYTIRALFFEDWL